jgi:hypothetical protein
MATKVGEIEVAVIARLDKLEKDLNTVKRKSQEAEEASKGSMARVSAAASKMGKQLLIAGAAMATVAGARAMGRAIKSSIDFADNLGKTASKLGVTTDFLQEMRFAADQSGVSIQTADMALQRFARRAAEAAVGTGEAKGALEQMRIELRDGEGQLRSTEALFSDAMKALGDIEDPAEKLRLAFKLFDSEGAALVNMAEGFKRLQKEAREMGIVLDQATIVKAEEAKGKIDALSMVMDTQLKTILIDLAPLLADSVSLFADLAREAGSAWGAMKGFFGGFNVKNVEDATEQLAALNLEMIKTQAKIRGLGRWGGKNRVPEEAIPGLRWIAEAQRAEAQKLKEYIERMTPESSEKSDSGLAFAWLYGNPEAWKEGAAKIVEINETAATDVADDWNVSTDDIGDDWDGLTNRMGDSFKDVLATMIIDGEVSFKQLGDLFIREVIDRAIGSTVDNFLDGDLLKDIQGFVGSIGSLLPGGGGGSQLNQSITDQQIFDTVGNWNTTRRSESSGVSVNVINASGERSETSETQNADGTRQIEVMIGKSVSADIHRGGPIDSAIKNAYGLKRPGTHGV